MVKPYRTSLFLFRRDLRLDDNTGLSQALSQSETVIPCFAFDPRQIGKTNPYRSEHAVRFLLASLQELDGELRRCGSHLHCCHGKSAIVIASLLARHGIDAVFVNRDYTPFSLERDAAIEAACEKKGVAFHSHGDALLQEPEDVHKDDGTPYGVFTPFYRKASSLAQRSVMQMGKGAFGLLKDESIGSFDQMKPGDSTFSPDGGRTSALRILRELGESTRAMRDSADAATRGSSHLSAHLKCGTCSVREVFAAVTLQLGPDDGMLRQLFWRDFFTHVAFHHSRVFGHAYHRVYDKVQWTSDPKALRVWEDGMTGFPIVDAAMRQLRSTGLLSNRLRMVTASFLVKDLHVDWRLGERSFATMLQDYDPCVNNGNWQWVASTGCDAKPYFRVFNPWLQQKKFDPDATYIKEWLPALRDIPAKAIHAWARRQDAAIDHPAPIVDHAREAALAQQLYRAARAA